MQSGNDKYDKRRLTQKERWQIADWIAEDNLPAVNDRQQEVPFQETFYTLYGKRALDILISSTALLVTLPVNAVVGIVTWFDVGRPVFFVQERVGRNRRSFYLVKFRNMKNTTDERGELLPAEQRVTAWGRFVRRTSIDELLNFWSIFKGDMSVIGPRPLPPQYTKRFSKRHRARFRVRAGLECPPRDPSAALRTWQDQFENDVWYVEHISLRTDILQCVNLVRYALNRKNAESRSIADKGDFMGYSPEGTAISLWEVPDHYIDRLEAEKDKENARAY